MKKDVIEMSPEQTADLAMLTAGAAQSSMTMGSDTEKTETPVNNLAGEIQGLIMAFVGIASPIFPSLKRIYTDETSNAAASSIAILCDKYGWAKNGLMGDWAEEVTAAIVILPLAIATVQGVKADISENKRKEAYIEMRKEADLRQHMNIAHNLDGQTIPDTGVMPQPSGLQGWQPPHTVPEKNDQPYDAMVQ